MLDEILAGIDVVLGSEEFDRRPLRSGAQRGTRPAKEEVDRRIKHSLTATGVSGRHACGGSATGTIRLGVPADRLPLLSPPPR
jgi:hypothetical protein